MNTWYYVVINGHTNGYHNSLENIKNGLYELFGDVPIAIDDEVMSSVGVDWSIEIREVTISPYRVVKNGKVTDRLNDDG